MRSVGFWTRMWPIGSSTIDLLSFWAFELLSSTSTMNRTGRILKFCHFWGHGRSSDFDHDDRPLKYAQDVTCTHREPSEKYKLHSFLIWRNPYRAAMKGGSLVISKQLRRQKCYRIVIQHWSLNVYALTWIRNKSRAEDVSCQHRRIRLCE